MEEPPPLTVLQTPQWKFSKCLVNELKKSTFLFRRTLMLQGNLLEMKLFVCVSSWSIYFAISQTDLPKCLKQGLVASLVSSIDLTRQNDKHNLETQPILHRQ